MKRFLFRLFNIPCSHKVWKQIGAAPYVDPDAYWWECRRCGKERLEDADWPAVSSCR